MADCKETLNELEPYIAGELSADAMEHIHTHLDGCVDCQQAFEFHLELKAAIRRKVNNDELPNGLLMRLESCFNEDFDGDGNVGVPSDR